MKLIIQFNHGHMEKLFEYSKQGRNEAIAYLRHLILEKKMTVLSHKFVKVVS